MQVPKPTDADKARFRSLVPEAPGVEVKPMFGNLGGFVNGNMFMGLFGPDIGVKLGPAEIEELRTLLDDPSLLRRVPRRRGTQRAPRRAGDGRSTRLRWPGNL